LQVKNCLKKWFLQTAIAYAHCLPHTLLDACSKVGGVMTELGEYESAMHILHYGLARRSTLFSPATRTTEQHTEIVANLFHEAAWSAYRMEDMENARKLCTEGLGEVEKAGYIGLAVSRLHRMRGRTYVGEELDPELAGESPASAEDIACAIRDFQRSETILADLQGLESEDAAKLYNNLGMAYTLAHEFDKAQEAFEDKTGTLRYKLSKAQGPSEAVRLFNLASMLFKRARQDRCEDSLLRARANFTQARDLAEKSAMHQSFIDRCENRCSESFKHMDQQPSICRSTSSRIHRRSSKSLTWT